MPLVASHDPIHVLVYGDSGSWKSSFAATGPKPMKVFCFDAFGKETPYLKMGRPQPLTYREDDNTPIRSVLHPKLDDIEIISIEFYHDAIPEQPTAYARFRKRMARFHHEYDEWQTVVVDSITSMELVARKEQQYTINPNRAAKEGQGSVAGKGQQFDPRQWWNGSTDAIEEMLMMRFLAFPMNVFILAHVDEQMVEGRVSANKDQVLGRLVRNPAAPGRLRKNLPSQWPEVYHSYIDEDGDGNRVGMLQTRSDKEWNAASQVGVVNPCLAHYRALWVGVK